MLLSSSHGLPPGEAYVPLQSLGSRFQHISNTPGHCRAPGTRTPQ